MNYILDTNVLMVANGDKSEQATAECIRACRELILSLLENNEAIILDTRQTFLVLKEYLNNIDPKQPLAGSQFLLQVLKNASLRIELPITPQNGSFAEFPDDTRLDGYDPSDRKWIALARVYIQQHPDQPSPPIIEATDYKWHKFEAFFNEYGVVIDWICE